MMRGWDRLNGITTLHTYILTHNSKHKNAGTPNKTKQGWIYETVREQGRIVCLPGSLPDEASPGVVLGA